MARAVTSQLKMKKSLKQIEALSTDLNKNLAQLTAIEPNNPAYADTLNQMQNIVQELVQLSTQED
jgi:hypothetical protein